MSQTKKEAAKVDPNTGKPFGVLVLGPAITGKTCAVVWFTENRYMSEYDPHICFDPRHCTVGGAAIALMDGPEVLLEHDPLLTDFQEYVPQAIGVLAFLDVTRRQTVADMHTIIRGTQEMRTSHGCAALPVFVIGSHLDQPDKREVSVEEGRAAAEEHGARYAEVSSYTGENVHAVFTEAITELLACYPGANDNESEDADADSSHRRRGCTHQ